LLKLNYMNYNHNIHPNKLHNFPTRRSSDLKKEEVDNLEENNQGEIKIEDLYSDKTLKVLKKLINPEDDIQKIIHKRERNSPYYFTRIKTSHYSIDVKWFR